MSKDAWEGDDLRPQTLNAWSYSLNNPINYIDPSGYCIGPVIVTGEAGTLEIISLDDCLGGIGGGGNSGGINGGRVIGAVAVGTVIGTGAVMTAEELRELYNRPSASAEPEREPKPLIDVVPPICPPEPEPKWYLYHYTDDAGLAGILVTQQIWASRRNPADPNSDAQWGNGQYFTDISPQDTRRGSAYQLSRALFTTPWKPNKVKNFVKINVAGLPVSRVADVFSRTYGNKSIYLHRSENSLNVTGRIEESGPTPFK